MYKIKKQKQKKMVVQVLVMPIEKDKLYNLAIVANARGLYDFCRKYLPLT
jgi:hypothetical protein